MSIDLPPEATKAAAVPARDNALQIGVRVMCEAGREGMVYSSRLVIAFAP